MLQRPCTSNCSSDALCEYDAITMIYATEHNVIIAYGSDDQQTQLTLIIIDKWQCRCSVLFTCLYEDGLTSKPVKYL